MWTPLYEKGVAIAIFSFHGVEILPGRGIDLDLGDAVHVLQECGEWRYGYVKTRREKKGIFPASYVQLKPYRRDKSVPDTMLTKSEDPVVRECRAVAREWGDILKQLYVSGGQSTYEFHALICTIRDVVDGRRQLIIGTLTQDQIRELKLRLTLKMDWKNRSLGLDLVPRVGYEIASPDEMGAVELYHVHKRSAENAESGKGTVRKKRSFSAQKAIGHHLYCSLRAFSYQSIDDCEIYFSLFDAQRMQSISERFIVKANGMSSFVDKLQQHGTTVFEDLGSVDLHSELYLIVQVIRVGKMFAESTKKSSQMYKRPFACGVLNIGEVVVPKNLKTVDNIEEDLKLPTMFADPEARELSFKLYSTDEKEFSQLHEHLIKKQMGKVSVVSGSLTIVELKPYTGDINTIRQENPIVFKNAVTTRKLGFPDIIYPGDVRNDIYVTLEHGEFEKGGKPTGKNIEVSFQVLDDNGCVIPNSIFGAVSSCGSGTDEYQSVILYHHNSPRWNETIRVTVPIEKFPFAHLRIDYNHCSTKDKNTKKLFGFSFVKLIYDEGTTIKDGPHELLVYKCEDRNKLRDPQNYLGLPFLSNSSGHHIIGNQSFQRSTKEVLTISTLLVSTKLTQNLDLVSLLKWRSNPDKIRETLENMTKVSGEEIVKFLQDVLDVLFTMFLNEEGESNDNSGDVFIVLVNIFVLLEQGKFEHFKPVIDAYITDHFAAALVYRGLVSTVQHYAEVVLRASKEFYPQIQKCFESLEFIFKFIAQSYILFARATGTEIKDSVTNNVANLFMALNSMLDDTPMHQADYVPIQAALLYNLSKMYNELVRIMPNVELAKMVCELFTNIPLKESAHPLSPAKLTALHHLVKSNLFREKDCRSIILPEVCRHLRHHLSLRQELKLCTEVLDDVLIFLHGRFRSEDNRIHDDIETVATCTLEMLVQSVLVLERTSPIVGNLVTCLIGLLQLMDQFHYNRLWDEFRESKPLRDLLLRVFLVFRDLIKHDVYPVDWLVMKLLTDSIMLKSLHEFSQPLNLYFLNKHSFDSQLWSQYFNLAVTYLTQPALQLEKFRVAKRDSILQRYGDMRVQMGFQILNMWSNLGENKISFIPSMVGPFLEVTLVPEMELRKATLNIFYDMLEAEQKYHGDFKQVECELIDKLDMLVSQNKGDDEYRQLFNSILLERINRCDPPWKSTGISFINSVTRLLERLLDYRNVLQGDENRDKRMACTVNLLDFYKTEINRQEMYLRYIYKLHDLHLSAENYTEAGFTLLLHAEMLNWSCDKLPAEGNYPAQQEMERKEEIYLRILKYFDHGKMWEKGIPLCKELAHRYEFKFFSYTKLSQILKTQASFFENILTQLRPEPEYFRVGFFGKGFPLFVRNKEFIYRGLEYERLVTFIQRIMTEWPAAEILKNIPPDESIINSDSQFIQICNVKPIPDTNNPIFKDQVPEKIQAYYKVNNVDAFSFDRRLKKFVQEDPDTQNEFKNMWIERTRMRTGNPLPGILRWFEVIEKKVEQITPVRFACERIEDVNREVKCLMNQYTGDQPAKNVNPLSMKLQGILDATVMGGLANYRDAFFTPDFLRNNPDSIVHVNKLRQLILEQVNILEQGLSIHGKLALQQVQPLHNRLVECFAQMKANVEKDFSRSPAMNMFLRKSETDSTRDSGRRTLSSSSIVNTPLPAPPLATIELKRLTESSSNRSSNSSGYGQVLGAFFDQHSDEDEDVYSKPNEPKEYASITITNNSNSLSNANSEPSLVTPPPIPNRQRARLLQSASCPRNQEYIFMPPNRVRELCGNGIDKRLGKLNSLQSQNSLDESLTSSQNSFYTANGSPAGHLNGNSEDISVTDGPPLPPRTDKKSCDGEPTEPPPPPPVLPKRQPRRNTITPKNSTESDQTCSLSSPSSPTKIGPPVPPKPKSNNRDSVNSEPGHEIYLNKEELMEQMSHSPSFEETFENIQLKPNEKKVTIETEATFPERQSPNNNSIQRNPSRTSHKEFFNLPFENVKKD